MANANKDGAVAKRLAELGLELPAPPQAVGAYRPFILVDQILYVSGQLPMQNGQLAYTGKVGTDLVKGKAAAKLVALNILAQAKLALDGNLDRVHQIIKLGGFINCADNFTDHPAILNGASDVMGEIFAERGRHARFAVGVNSLPMDATVEIEAIIAID